MLVSDDELASLKLVAHLTTCLLSKLKAQGVQAHSSALRFHGIVLCDADELAPLLPTLNTGGLRWVLCVRVDEETDYGYLMFGERRYTSYVFVKTLTGKIIALDMSLHAFVDDVKEMIADMEGIPPDVQRLVFDGQQLADDGNLAEYNITAGCVVQLILPLPGGGDPAVFATVEVADARHTVTFSLSAPRWRAVGQGLNLHGTCLNRACVAYTKEVIAPIGLRPFNVIAQRAYCPMCRHSIVARTCGFYKCKWRYEGVKSESGVYVASPWKTLPSQKAYILFDDGECNLSFWRSLALIAQAPSKVRTCVLCNTRDAIERRGCGHMHLHCAKLWIENSAARRVIDAICPHCHKSINLCD
ncbi:hypothetical protein SDRG_11214 [Saprolegnia diclina VS20]|uniref:Ubiquitin-like domain-containing protein n=1 Tax=Saprolegnia diclina (strain VS20) TaxID=1156394 RepID=T0RM53_SAPDV|nr:hypothetical protein SDRG_11214 [Saprolegnia diclina VS20]EQC31027.1 hypothetical protein SDRG_11214 [Saprolegnia diclina VS20]|eukprot:XP_008615466.1 hypothetical protein SDRG_11214 [Saprolegnia diclina VS20]